MTEIKTDEVYQLGAWMGRKQAFASLAGRCSAADAECLRQIREHKRYRALKRTSASAPEPYSYQLRMRTSTPDPFRPSSNAFRSLFW